MSGVGGAPGDLAPRSVAVDDLVMIDGQAVAYLAGAVHQLNPTATLLWQSCDGEVSLDDLAGEFAGVFGADRDLVCRDVLSAAAELLAGGLLATTDDLADPVGEFSGPVLQPAASCSGCGDGPDFEHHVVVAVDDDLALSIGADPDVASALVEAFGSRVIAHVDHPRDRASYGLVLPSGSRDRGLADLARLHRGPDVLLASRDPERVLRALFAQVATHALEPNQLLVEGIAVGRDGRVVVVPAPQIRAAYERGAERVGLAVTDTTAVIVVLNDPSTVVVGNPWPEIDLEPLRRVASTRRNLGPEPRALAWGTYELEALAVSGPPTLASVLGELVALGGPGSTPPLAPVLELVRRTSLMSGTRPEAVAGAFPGPRAELTGVSEGTLTA